MNIVANFEHRASSSRGKHEGESSFALCDRLSRTRDNSQRQLPTDHDYAVPTREYQTDQSSLKSAPAAARSVLEKKQRQLQEHPHRLYSVDTVTHIRDMHLLRIHARQLVTEEPLLELIDSDFRSAVGHQNISEGAEPRFASPCRVFGILPSVPMKAPRCL